MDKFYAYSGRVETLPCALRQYVFDDINLSQQFQCFAGSNEGYSEVWWFYCSTDSTRPDRYIIYNYLDKIWYYGTLERSAWLDSPLRDFPMGATCNHTVVYDENGTNDEEIEGQEVPINAYIQSSDFDIGDGHNFGFVWRIIPDITFDGSETSGLPDALPQVTFTVRPRQNPGANYGTAATPTVTSDQSYVNQKTYTVVVVSAGFTNRFGHPHDEALARFRSVGARVYRTDRDGQVRMTPGTRSWAVDVTVPRDGTGRE